MKDPLIEELQRKRDSARFTAHQTSTDAAWHEFHLVRNKLKSAIRTAQEAFIEKALYSNKSHKVWKVIQRGLKPSARPLRFDPDELNDFCKRHSTTTALLRVRDNIRYAMKRKEFMLMVLANFWKAFDTISFSATIMKFYKLGFLKPFLKWLLSYLSRRSQFMQIDNRNSSNQSSQYSIPQGSILGPMIFNL